MVTTSDKRWPPLMALLAVYGCVCRWVNVTSAWRSPPCKSIYYEIVRDQQRRVSLAWSRCHLRGGCGTPLLPFVLAEPIPDDGDGANKVYCVSNCHVAYSRGFHRTFPHPSPSSRENACAALSVPTIKMVLLSLWCLKGRDPLPCACKPAIQRRVQLGRAPEP